MIKIIGIDPGSNDLGVSIFTLTKGVISNIETIPIDLNISPYYDTSVFENRMIILRKFIEAIFKEHKPNYLVIEDNFINQGRLSAVTGLITSVTIITTIFLKNSKLSNLIKIAPSRVKNVIGVKGNSSDKKDMLKAMKKINIITKYIELSDISDHEIDALAIGYYLAKT